MQEEKRCGGGCAQAQSEEKWNLLLQKIWYPFIVHKIPDCPFVNVLFFYSPMYRGPALS